MFFAVFLRSKTPPTYSLIFQSAFLTEVPHRFERGKNMFFTVFLRSKTPPIHIVFLSPRFPHVIKHTKHIFQSWTAFVRLHRVDWDLYTLGL